MCGNHPLPVMSRAPLLARAASAPLKVCAPIKERHEIRQLTAADPRSTLFSCRGGRLKKTNPAETEVKGVTGVTVKEQGPLKPNIDHD